MGRIHAPFFRLSAIDSRTPRDGRVIEELGHYDPMIKDKTKRFVVKLDRANYWLNVGAIPSETVSSLLTLLLANINSQGTTDNRPLTTGH
jgi:small subunit ribosomal protein S16